MPEPKGLTRAELIAEVSRAAELQRKEAARVVETILDAIVDALRSGQEVELRGFGSFRIRERAGRRGRNPKTGESVSVPPKRVPFFRPGKELRAQLNRTRS